MKAAQLIAPKTHQIIDLPMPKINEFEVLVKIEICGLCASELHNWAMGDALLPTYLGHEPVGVVIEIGKYVQNVVVGDRVTGLIHKSFAQYAKAHSALVIKVPENLDSPSALGEPLGCLISGARNTPLDLGDRVAVIGLGYMGLAFLQLMRLKGAGYILGIDVRSEGCQMALQLGADETKHPDKISGKDKVLEFGKNMDRGFDVVIEASGTAPGLELASQITGIHKTLSVVGFHQGDRRAIDMCLWNWKAIKVINAHERRKDYMMDCIRRGLALVKYKSLDMSPLITHSYPLADLDRGFTDFLEKKNGYIKGYISIE